jgi:hypothetical protein
VPSVPFVAESALRTFRSPKRADVFSSSRLFEVYAPAHPLGFLFLKMNALFMLIVKTFLEREGFAEETQSKGNGETSHCPIEVCR